jgi:hypothetical protein
LRHRGCGRLTHVVPHCASCGEALHAGDVDFEDGPGAAVAQPG